MQYSRCKSLISWATLSLILASPAFATPGSVEFFVNGQRNFDHALQLELPADFGTGEFTFEVWIRLNDSFPVGSVAGGTAGQLQNWATDDPQPYSSSNWWFKGNFLLDGHNNRAFQNGTFSLQVYGGGRLRWLFGDGVQNTGGPWAVQAWPATSTPSLLDGAWHQVTLVRRFPNGASATLEMWIDGQLIASETSSAQTDMGFWWDNWRDFQTNQDGWYWGAEKQAGLSTIPQYEDYKGLVDEMRFWSRAKSASEIADDFNATVTGSETGLVGYIPFAEATGTSICYENNPALDCLTLINAQSGVWSTEEAPLVDRSDTEAPTTPTGFSGAANSDSQVTLTWNASTDNIAVADYRVFRNGALVATVASPGYVDSGLAAATTYNYAIDARDAAGNVSGQATTSVTTNALTDTTPPSQPGSFAATAISSSRIDLSWTASSDNVGVVAYDLRRDGALIASPASTAFSDTGLGANTSFSYDVTARDAAGNVSSAATASATTMSASNNPVPQLSSLNPTSVTEGGSAFSLVLLGADFVSNSIVRWNGADRPSTFVSDAELRASISAADVAAAGTAAVTVFSPTPGGGTSAAQTFTIDAATANNPVPQMGGLSPSSATEGGSAFSLTVQGSNFVANSVVRWNGADRGTNFVSSAELQAAITAADIATDGTASVSVFNPAPGGGTSSSRNFTINAAVSNNPAPQTSGLSPTTATAGGSAFNLTVLGSNFITSSVVRWDSADVATTFVSPTELQASISAADIAAAGNASVTVFTPAPGGGTSSAQSFTISAPSVNPPPQPQPSSGGGSLAVRDFGLLLAATLLAMLARRRRDRSMRAQHAR